MMGSPVRVLLINPNQMRPPIAPIGLDYLADALSRRGHRVEILDLCFHSDVEKPTADAIGRFLPEVIGVTIRNTDDCHFGGQDFILPRIREVITAVRRISQAPVVLGGVAFSIAPRETLEFLGADYGVRGEGEESCGLLAERIVHGGGLEEVPGLVYRKNGRVVQTPPSFMNLDSLPSWSRRFVDNARYFGEGGQIGFETKRGCPMSCVYCPEPAAKGKTVRMRSPIMVAEELRALLDQGADHFHTCDSEFNLPEDHATAVCEEIARAGMGDKIRWYAYCAPAPFSRKLAAAMKKAGCAGIDFGADSGDDRILRNLGRRFTANDLRRTARLCREYEIPFMYDLLIGGPGETPASVKNTVELMKEIGPDCVGTAIGVRVYDGTKIAGMIRAEGPLAANPNLHGAAEDNPGFLKPIFYISSSVGPDVFSYVEELIGGDPRFFFGSRDESEQNYNYNDNSILVNAIRQGYRGAYWDILRRLRQAG